MDHLQERLDALEQRTHTVERQLRWWRRLAGGLIVVTLLTWVLLSGNAADAQSGKLADELAALRDLLTVIRFDAAANEVRITGANLRLVNGLGATDTTNGWGNLIVGYNEPRTFPGATDTRTGSHNLVVGTEHNFSSFGGIVVGLQNEILGAFASVSGGQGSRASGVGASVSGGRGNWALGESGSVSGGVVNYAIGAGASVSGGFQNSANGPTASVSGGTLNTASGSRASVSGGGGRVNEDVTGNTASGFVSSVSGGRYRFQQGSSTGWLGPSSKTSRHVVTVAARRAGGAVG
jgi:hypothetical protein